MVELRDYQAKIKEAGAALHFIGNGSVTEAAEFAQTFLPNGSLFTDPGRKAFELAGMKRGITTLLSLKILGRAAKAKKAGFNQTATKGSATQQGGVLIITPTGQEIFRLISNEPGEHPAPAEILAALPRS